MTTISAQTILRSRNTARPDKVLSTLLLRYPRCIHAEFMTHRMFSRNAASSRAIPVEKLIQDVLEDPFVPLHWGKNQKGMQADEKHDALVVLDDGRRIMNQSAWLDARNQTIEFARAFARAGYHKQIVNRLLEPFAHITVLVSATEWSNFLALRDHPDAEPHIQILAREVRKELDREDNIQDLAPGKWHLPFITSDDITKVRMSFGATVLGSHYLGLTEALIKKSSACCASTSYKTVDGFDMTLERAQTIYDKLVEKPPLHASPFEHVAQADDWDQFFGREGKMWDNPSQHGNFIGFKQYRKMLPNECL